jgi:aryl-alcohol dehydrogenase-like predicted oxidoreductase
MIYRNLQDLQVSLLGLGTVKFGRNTDVKYPQAFDLPSDADIINLLAAAFDLGINLLDTAPAYGLSEQRIGNLLHNRQQWLISTKVGEHYQNGQSTFDFSYQHTVKSVEQSLVNLKTDYLDIVLIHSNGDDLQILKGDTIDALKTMQQQGKIRKIGFSGKTLAGNLQALQVCDLAMVEFNLQNTGQMQVLDFACNNHKGIFIKKGLASGHLDAAASLQFLKNQPAITSIIVGSINQKHLQANVKEICNEK